MRVRKSRSVAMNRIPSMNSRPDGPAGASVPSFAGAKLAITPDMVAKPDGAEREDDPSVGERDDDAAEGGQEHAGALPEHGVESDRAHHVVAADKAREECQAGPGSRSLR